MTPTLATQTHDDAAAFAATLRDSVEALRLRVATVTCCHIELHYGATDDGSEHWAALTVEELPVGSFGRPGLLVSLLTGPGVPGFAVVMAGDWSAQVCTIASLDDVSDGLRVAESEALQQFAHLSEGSE